MSTTLATDPHRVGEFRIGYTRVGVFEPIFEGLIASGATVPVTRRRRIVSATSDLYTGHPNVSYSEEQIDAVIQFTTSSRVDLGIGAVGEIEGVIMTADPLRFLDQFDYNGKRYEVVTNPIDVRGRDWEFIYRKAGFKSIEFSSV